MKSAAIVLSGIEMGEDEYLDPPTADIEIVSPDQNIADLRLKCRLYRARGADVCWLVHPDQRWVEVWDAASEGTRLAGGDALQSAALPGLRLELAQLWAAIDAAPA